MRYHLQRVVTNEWLSRDLPLVDGVTTRALSQPGGISGAVEPELRHRRHSDGLLLLEKWGSILYAEDDGLIRGGGIVTDVNYEGAKATVEAPGFTVYPKGMPFLGSVNHGPQVDPLDMIRYLWAHVQSQPDGDLDLVVDSTTSPVRIGDNAEPYRLRWFDTVDIGGEIDNLAQQAPCDYAEEHRWTDATKSAVSHRLRIGYPRLGRRRTDLRFVEGENVTTVVPVVSDGDLFANDINGIGKGEGSAMVRVRAAVRDGRLRRAATITDKTANLARMTSVVRAAMAARNGIDDVSEVTILDHPNARVSAITPGDDILLDVDQPAYGRARLWLRVLVVAEEATGDTATLTTQRSSAFTYSATQETL